MSIPLRSAFLSRRQLAVSLSPENTLNVYSDGKIYVFYSSQMVNSKEKYQKKHENEFVRY